MRFFNLVSGLYEAGTTGVSTGVHLHFAVRNASGNYIEPLAYLSHFEQDAAPLIANSIPRKIVFAARSPQRSVRSQRDAVARSGRSASARRSSPNQIASASKGIPHPPAKSSSSIASPKRAAAPIVAAKPKPKLTPDQLMDFESRVAKAASEAETFAKLYDEGGISRNDRDSKVAAATAARTRLQAAKDTVTN